MKSGSLDKRSKLTCIRMSPELRKAVRIQAATEDISMARLFENVLRAYIEDGIVKDAVEIYWEKEKGA
jgi:hypothetical protein